MAQKGFTLWMTGLSGAGKSTLSEALFEVLKGRGLKTEILDGDVIRTYLSSRLGFSKQDRDDNIRRVGFVAQILARNEVICIAACISPYRKVRAEIRERVGSFIEVFVSCPLEVCEERDVKGLYAKARAGEITNFTGIDDPYEAPETPEIVCHTDQESVSESVEKVLGWLTEQGWLEPA